MEQVQALIQYFSANPATAAGAVAVLAALYYLVNRKSKLSRAADEQMERLRRERGEYYTKLRPPS